MSRPTLPPPSPSLRHACQASSTWSQRLQNIAQVTKQWRWRSLVFRDRTSNNYLFNLNLSTASQLCFNLALYISIIWKAFNALPQYEIVFLFNFQERSFTFFSWFLRLWERISTREGSTRAPIPIIKSGIIVFSDSWTAVMIMNCKKTKALCFDLSLSHVIHIGSERNIDKLANKLLLWYGVWLGHLFTFHCSMAVITFNH